MIYLIRGPFEKKGRKYVIIEEDGKRRKINYAKYLLLKDGVEIGKYEQVHHKDHDKSHDVRDNLEPLKEFKHKEKDKHE